MRGGATFLGPFALEGFSDGVSYFGVFLTLVHKKTVVANIDLERLDFTASGVAGHSIFVPMPRWWNGIN